MPQKDNPLKAFALTGGILSQLSGSTLIGVFFGRWLDHQFSTSPLFLIIGLFLGLSTGTYGTIYLVRKHMGED